MNDITSLFDSYRECVRHLWNQFYRPIHQARSDAVYWTEFSHIEDSLFYDLILRQLGYEYGAYFNNPTNIHQRSHFEPFKLILDGHFGVAAMISRQPMISGYWDHPVTNLDSSVSELRYVSLFDWDEQGFKIIIFSCENHTKP